MNFTEQKIANQSRKFILLRQLKSTQKIGIQQINNEQITKQTNLQGSETVKKQYSSRKFLQKIQPMQKEVIKEKDYSDVYYFSNQILNIKIQKYDSQKKQAIPCLISKIKANGKISAAFDNKGNVWLLGMIFPNPINLTQILKKKIIDGFLGEKGIIIKTKKNFYVVNWDKIDLPKQILKKIQIDKKYEEYFQCWEQVIPYRSDAWFLFSSKKDSFVETSFYHIFSERVIIYPSFRQVNIKRKIAGLSVSKTHALCWSECGKIFSWGQNSIALGYTDYSQQNKQKQIESVNFHVISAVAGFHYSVALSSDGELYEWGIKNVLCQKTKCTTEQFIFVPKKLIVSFNSAIQKIACLKGFQNHYGALSFNQNLHVWGKTIPRKLLQFDGKTQQNNEKTQANSSNTLEPTIDLVQPTLCKCSQNVKIVDFQMREDYVFLVIANKKSKLKNQLCQKFWQNRLRNISSILQDKKLRRTQKQKNDRIEQTIDKNQLGIQFSKMQANNVKLRKHRKHQSALQFYNSNQDQGIDQNENKKSIKIMQQINKRSLCFQDKIASAIKQKLSKQKYFNSLCNQQRVFKSIMRGSQNASNSRSRQKIQHYMIPKNDKINYVKFQRKFRNKTSLNLRHSEDSSQNKNLLNYHRMKKLKNNSQQQNITPIDYQKIQYLLKNSPVQEQKKRRQRLYNIIKQKQHYFHTTKNSRCNSPNKDGSDLYELKLTQVLNKKQSICNDFFQSTIEKIEKSSIQFRRKQSEQTAARKQRQERQKILKQTLFQYLKKIYIVKCLTSPIPYGRQTKIKVFVSNLKYNRIQKSVRRLFATTRIRFDVHILKEYMPVNFLKLLIIYKNFIRKWRQNKRKRLIKYSVEQVIRINLKNKMKLGLHKARVNIKNLQKIGAWLQISKNQKIKCINAIWKKQLLNLFGVEQQFQGQYNALNMKNEIKNFKQLYLQKLKNNPMLKIQNYLGVSPLFKVKMLQNCQVNFLQLMLKKKQTIDQQLCNPTNIQLTKRSTIKYKTKIKEEQEQKFDLRYYVLNQNLYLLPYSKHLNVFKKPKQLEINIADNVKQSQIWEQEQKKLLTKIFSKIIKNDQIEYQRKMYKYRREMAMFIRDNYSKISEKRWKYIIQYNQIKKNKDQKQINKKQKQLRKLLRTIGCQPILNSDILPQKHRILQQARQMKGAPELPQKWMNITSAEFKKAFKQFFQALQNKAKSNKRYKSFHPA